MVFLHFPSALAAVAGAVAVPLLHLLPSIEEDVILFSLLIGVVEFFSPIGAVCVAVVAVVAVVASFFVLILVHVFLLFPFLLLLGCMFVEMIRGFDVIWMHHRRYWINAHSF